MSFNKKTIREYDLHGKKVLLRADYNVPIKNGRITDDYRIKQSLPTIHYLLEQNVRLVIISHLGRPKGPNDKMDSLRPVAADLSRRLGKKVEFAGDCVGQEVEVLAAKLEPGQILLLENLRFHPEEKKNDPEFARRIIESTGAEVFVQDGFGVVHRADASTDAMARQLPALAGLLLEKEVDTITRVMEDPARPLTALVGGAKISDKIDILNRLIDIADCVAVAGAMANNFLLAEGHELGQSLIEKEALDTTKEILAKARQAEKERNFNFLVPVDAVVSTAIDGTKPTRVVDLASRSLDDIEAYPKKPYHRAYSVLADELVLDIGPMSAYQIAGAVKMAETVIWNGTCGVTETKGLAGAPAPFAHGTDIVVSAMIGPSNRHKNKPFTLVGGGDTVGYVEQEGLVEDFSHVSTGGGASLELMSGHSLPGVEALWNK
ncbi:MAG TPA: phosphoglycerate kinase [Candidatus Saccharimonadales bacterium]|nr:phosphoglycerate kinase [Candidatus Saccharimonadales bacterium]